MTVEISTYIDVRRELPIWGSINPMPSLFCPEISIVLRPCSLVGFDPAPFRSVP
jgi:hypothetical protein